MTTPDPNEALLGPHADIVGRPTFRNGALTHAWIRRDVAPERYAALLSDPRCASIEEIALYGGSDAEPVLQAIAEHRPATLVSLRFGATEDVDLSPWWSHLAAFERLALSGSVHTGPIDAPTLRFLGWVNRRGTGVSFGRCSVGLTDVWMRTPRDAARAFFENVQTPELTRLTVDTRLDDGLVEALCTHAAALPKLKTLAARGLPDDPHRMARLHQAFPGTTLSAPG